MQKYMQRYVKFPKNTKTKATATVDSRLCALILLWIVLLCECSPEHILELRDVHVRNR